MRDLALASRASSHRVLRVFEALRADAGEEAVDSLYTEWGRRLFRPGPPKAPPPGLEPGFFEVSRPRDPPVVPEPGAHRA